MACATGLGFEGRDQSVVDRDIDLTARGPSITKMCAAACEASSVRWESPPETSTIFLSCLYVSDYT
jgi:hypothetical protein